MSSRTLIGAIIVGLVGGVALPTVSFAHQWHRHHVYRHHQPHRHHHDAHHYRGQRYYEPMAHHQAYGQLHFRWSAPAARFGIVWNVPVQRTHANKNMHGARRPRYRAESHQVRQSFVTTDGRPLRHKGERRRHTGFKRSTRVRTQR